MSTSDLTFTIAGETIYDPVLLTSSVAINVTNYGDEALSNLGFYIVPATSIGDVDFPADSPPETDYEDLITWGTQADLGDIPQGGLYLMVPTNDGEFSGYITRTQGAVFTNKISVKDMAAGEIVEFSIEFETPTGVPARRFYIDCRIE